MSKHTPGPCRKCGRDYKPEPFDLGICCICLRDLAFERVFGPEWRDLITAEDELADLQRDNLTLASLAEVLLSGNTGFDDDKHREILVKIRDLRALPPRERVVERECTEECAHGGPKN